MIWTQCYEWFEEILRWLGVCGEKEGVFIFKDVAVLHGCGLRDHLENEMREDENILSGARVI